MIFKEKTKKKVIQKKKRPCFIFILHARLGLGLRIGLVRGVRDRVRVRVGLGLGLELGLELGLYHLGHAHHKRTSTGPIPGPGLSSVRK